MTCVPTQEVLDEIEALISVYGEERVTVDKSSDPLTVTIRVDLEPLASPSTLWITTQNGRKSHIVNVLPPLYAKLSIPEKYPAVSPSIAIECQWMDQQMADRIKKKLLGIFTENIGMPVMFYCCDAISEEIKDMEIELKEICLDNVVSAGQSNEIFSLLIDSSEESESRIFNSECYDCEVCLENKMGNDCVKFFPCNHVFCKECIKGFFVSQTTSSEMNHLKCLGPKCESLATDKVIRVAIGSEEFERYEQILLEKALVQMGDVVVCARPTCQKPVIISQQNPTLASCDCGFSFCIICKRAYHGLDECETGKMDKVALLTEWGRCITEEDKIQMARRFGGLSSLRKVVDTIQNQDWMKEFSKACPRCRAFIQKDEGCNKMHCTNCQVYFCWICVRILDKGDPYGHFREGGQCGNRLFEGVGSDDDDDDFMFEMDEEDTDDENSDGDENPGILPVRF